MGAEIVGLQLRQPYRTLVDGEEEGGPEEMTGEGLAEELAVSMGEALVLVEVVPRLQQSDKDEIAKDACAINVTLPSQSRLAAETPSIKSLNAGPSIV